MNRQEIRELVIDATGRTDKVSLINRAINLAVAEVSSQRLWTDLQTEADVSLTEGVRYVDLGVEVTRVSEIRLLDGESSGPLDIRPKDQVISLSPYPENASTSKPRMGYLEGTKLYLVPVPDDDYTIRFTYYKLHPALDNDTDEVLIRHAATAVVAFATLWVFKSLEKLEDEQRWLATYVNLLNSAKKVDKDNTVVIRQAQPYGQTKTLSGNPQLDPFVRSVR